MKITIAVAALGSMGCAWHGQPAMATMFVAVILLAEALRRIERRIGDIEESLLGL